MLFPEFDAEEWADLFSDPDRGRVSIRMAASLLGVSTNLLQEQIVRSRHCDNQFTPPDSDESTRTHKRSAKRPVKPARLF